MRLLFFGSPPFAVPALRGLHRAGHEIARVVTRPDRARGRHGSPVPTAVKEAALDLALEVFQPPIANAPEAVRALRDEGAELGVVVAFGEILSADLLSVTRQGFINLHASLLPDYRGAAPINWAVMRGETKTGASVIRMLPKLDAGPILAQTKVPIGPDETAGELADRLSSAGAELVVDLVGRLDAGERPAGTPQPRKSGFFARKLTKEDGRVDWRLPARAIGNHVRGLHPWPGAHCTFVGSERTVAVALLGFETSDEDADPGSNGPGTVLSANAEGVVVQAGAGTVRITRLKPSGSRAMSAGDFARGYHVGPGDCFE
jgi:methionyl-tRNA formyltransferase